MATSGTRKNMILCIHSKTKVWSILSVFYTQNFNKRNFVIFFLKKHLSLNKNKITWNQIFRTLFFNLKISIQSFFVYIRKRTAFKNTLVRQNSESFSHFCMKDEWKRKKFLRKSQYRSHEKVQLSGPGAKSTKAHFYFFDAKYYRIINFQYITITLNIFFTNAVMIIIITILKLWIGVLPILKIKFHCLYWTWVNKE